MSELILKTEANLKEGLIACDNYPWIMFSFNRLVIIWRGVGVRLKFDVQGQREGGGGGENIGRRWTRGVGGLENWTIFMDAI